MTIVELTIVVNDDIGDLTTLMGKAKISDNPTNSVTQDVLMEDLIEMKKINWKRGVEVPSTGK